MHNTNVMHFNPRPPCGGRLNGYDISVFPVWISIHAPRAGGDGDNMGTSATRAKFQSTPPVRGATLKPRRRACFQNISIHAPRAGGDAGGYQIIRRTQNISIHAPRAGGDAITRSTPDQTWTFQSTPPVRGATWRAVQLRKRRSISIHAPRAGGDGIGLK